ncbi:hypothetical protein AB1Y20_003012 [Prymnesium parvum]|uniref:EamA domain-containing protein n=1 Tax=Prymnesium parvum TaxID=97485 RepID=A0AB34JCV6_PRYPA
MYSSSVKCNGTLLIRRKIFDELAEARPNMGGAMACPSVPRGAALSLLGWQACSVMLTLTGYCSARLAQHGVHAPTAQSLLAYALLSLHCVPSLRRKHSPPAATQAAPRRPPWQWFLIALADVEANFLLVLAYQYTDMTSVTLLDAFTIPMVLLLSRLGFGTRYAARQLGAAAICIGGLVLLLLDDLSRHGGEGRGESGSGGAAAECRADGGDGTPSRPILGDALVLVGASIYAASNVVQERLVGGSGDRVEYLARLGGYGTLIAFVQCCVLERAAVAHALGCMSEGLSSGDGAPLIGLSVGFALSLTSFYILVATLLQNGSTATAMNLSLLTSDFWSVLVAVTLLHERVGYWYAFAFASVVFGLLLYHSSGGPSCPDVLNQPLVEECEAAEPAGRSTEHADTRTTSSPIPDR